MADGRRFWPALLCLVLVLLGVAWVAGRQVGSSGEPASLDAVRLGPDPGQRVADYLAGLPARLPPPDGAPVPALVQFGAEQDDASAARLLAEVDARSVVLRVPLPRVQTALRFEPLPPVDAPDPAVGLTRRIELAQQAARRQALASRLTGRAAAVAGYEAAALARPGRYVLAVLVVADRATLTRLAGLPEVRAVDAAPEGTPPTGVALAPLLPEQTDVVGPVPDDGPVPPAPPA